MNRDIEKLMSSLKRVSLSGPERARLRSALRASMRSAPATFSTTRRPLIMAPVAIALVLALSTGGGIALAAEGALPGEPLYAVKVNVDEKVAGALALSTEAKADLAARLAEKRLKETSELTSDDRLTPELKTELRGRLAEHLEDAKEKVSDLKRKGRDRHASKVEDHLRSSFDSHRASLDDLEVGVSFRESDEGVKLRGDGSIDDSIGDDSEDNSRDSGGRRGRDRGRIEIDF